MQSREHCESSPGAGGAPWQQEDSLELREDSPGAAPRSIYNWFYFSTLDIGAVKLSSVFSRSKSSYLSTDEFRLSMVLQALHILTRFSSLYTHLPSYTEIFKPVLHFCDRLPVKQYPLNVKVSYTTLLSCL